jgi:hypothetical protein
MISSYSPDQCLERIPSSHSLFHLGELAFHFDTVLATNALEIVLIDQQCALY